MMKLFMFLCAGEGNWPAHNLPNGVDYPSQLSPTLAGGRIIVCIAWYLYFWRQRWWSPIGK